MSDSQSEPWSDNSNTQGTPRYAYPVEKAFFAGNLIGSMFYGMLIVLFFKCMTALFNPIYHRGGGVKWGLVSYTAVMFLLATVLTVMNLDIQSISYIDNRDFPGVEGKTDPGPYGYLVSIYNKAINVTPNAAFNLNNWLADGFLLYRCHVIYSMNRWVIAFPCLMYLGSVAMGILTIYPIGERTVGNSWPALPYFSISLSLNVLLTLMIVVRLVLHGRNVRAATGSPVGISGLYKTVATMLIESSALFAVSSLLVIGPMAAGSSAISNAFFPVLAETQVIAPLLIIQRVASKSALTSDTITHGTISSFRARRRVELTGGSSTPPNEYPMKPMGEHGTNSGGLVAGAETTIDFRRSRA